MDNRGPAHVSCARAKTRDDAKRLAKAKRQKRKHLGIRQSKGRPMPGSKASGLKKRMNGKVERR